MSRVNRVIREVCVSRIIGGSSTHLSFAADCSRSLQCFNSRDTVARLCTGNLIIVLVTAVCARPAEPCVLRPIALRPTLFPQNVEVALSFMAGTISAREGQHANGENGVATGKSSGCGNFEFSFDLKPSLSSLLSLPPSLCLWDYWKVALMPRWD
jgi:hypothetical protein